MIPTATASIGRLFFGVFRHESSHGRRWQRTRAAGVICARQQARSGVCRVADPGRFAAYTHLGQQPHDWCELLRRFYIPAGLTVRTVTLAMRRAPITTTRCARRMS